MPQVPGRMPPSFACPRGRVGRINGCGWAPFIRQQAMAQVNGTNLKRHGEPEKGLTKDQLCGQHPFSVAPTRKLHRCVSPSPLHPGPLTLRLTSSGVTSTLTSADQKWPIRWPHKALMDHSLRSRDISCGYNEATWPLAGGETWVTCPRLGEGPL